MDTINKILTTAFLGASTILLGFITYFGNMQVDGLTRVTNKTSEIEVNQIRQQSNQESIAKEISYIKYDVSEIKASRKDLISAIKKNTEKSDSNTKLLDHNCTTLQTYWPEWKCK